MFCIFWGSLVVINMQADWPFRWRMLPLSAKFWSGWKKVGNSGSSSEAVWLKLVLKNYFLDQINFTLIYLWSAKWHLFGPGNTEPTLSRASMYGRKNVHRFWRYKHLRRRAPPGRRAGSLEIERKMDNWTTPVCLGWIVHRSQRFCKLTTGQYRSE